MKKHDEPTTESYQHADRALLAAWVAFQQPITNEHRSLKALFSLYLASFVALLVYGVLHAVTR